MDTGIEFGQLEHTGPRRSVRPDRDRRFAVVACGQIDQSDLPIFVDLDVMRDMEGHARTNTHVELGGVLLGGQHVAEDGRNFVVVREVLRAEHYEATRGSFKFTHDTWEQITRDREQLANDLQLVGWYHTHPDWGVFLSGMDMFICNHFFGGPLDVALVIDPCQGDRGWFFWQDEDGKRIKHQAASFYLMSNRYRRSELLQYAQALGSADPAFFDPRYETSTGEIAMQPVVHLHDQRSPLQSIALIGMLMVQFLFIALIAYRVLIPPGQAETPEQMAQLQNGSSASNPAYPQMLAALLENAADPQSKGIMKRFEALGAENQQLQNALEGQASLLTSLKAERNTLAAKSENLALDLKTAQNLNTQKNQEIKQLEGQVQLQAGAAAGGFFSRTISWPWSLGIALLTAIAGLFAGQLLARRQNEFDEPGFDKESNIPQYPDVDADEDNPAE